MQDWRTLHLHSIAFGIVSIHRQIEFRALHHHIALAHLLASKIITLPVLIQQQSSSHFLHLHNDIALTWFIVASPTTHLLALSQLFYISTVRRINQRKLPHLQVFSSIKYLCKTLFAFYSHKYLYNGVRLCVILVHVYMYVYTRRGTIFFYIYIE